MTIALFLVLFVVAVALIVVPRVRRARRGGRSRPRWTGRRAAITTATASPWQPGRAAAPAAGAEDEWDDDLGWVDPTPRRRPAAEGAGVTWTGGADDPAGAPVAAAAPAAPATPAITTPGTPAAGTAAAAAPAASTAAATDPAGSAAPARTSAGVTHAADPSAPLELEDDDWQLAPPPRPAAGPAAAAGAAGRRARTRPRTRDRDAAGRSATPSSCSRSTPARAWRCSCWP